MPALRVFAPPEDRVRELFAGSNEHNHVIDRKVLEQERKKAYAAELQAQMQERQVHKQQERQQRFGPAPGALSPRPRAAAGPGRDNTAAYTTRHGAAATHDSVGGQVAAASSTAANGTQDHKQPGAPDQPGYGIAQPLSPHAPTYQHQQQHQRQLHQQVFPQPELHHAGSFPGMSSAMHFQGPGSLSSSSSPPPWLQHAPQQQQQPPYASHSVCSPMHPLQQQQQQAMSWPAPLLQQSPHGAARWPDSPTYNITGTPLGYDCTSTGHGPGHISPGRDFQSAAAAAAMQAAAQAGGHHLHSWGADPAPSMHAAARHTNQRFWPDAADSDNTRTGFDLLHYSRSPAAAVVTSGAPPSGLGSIGSNGSPQGPRSVQERARKDAYRAELEAQIRQRAEQKAAEKRQRDADEARKEAEVAAYSPWGRGGSGAPLRDAAGKVITGRGGARQQEQQQQQQQQQQHSAQSASWQHHAAAGDECLDVAPAGNGSQASSPHQPQAVSQQQQGGSGASVVPGGGGSGPAPVLCFRSDKAFMTSQEIEAKQRQQRELQEELDRQVQERARNKELKRQQEEEEARQEEARLATEQARLAAQFQQEQDLERGRIRRQGNRAGGDVDQQQQGLSSQNTAGRPAEPQHSKHDRRRVPVLVAGGDLQPSHLQQPQQNHGLDLAGQASSRDAAGGSLQQAIASPLMQQQLWQQSSVMAGQEGSMSLAPQLRLLDQQQRQQLLHEALQLEGHTADQAAAQEVTRLRQDMELQAAALRSAVESQGREVAVLRATAAAAEAESAAAKAELAQVKSAMAAKSRELPHETLSTMLADYGDKLATSLVTAAYHPGPVRRIELELPPSAATLRRSIEAHAYAEVCPDGAADTGAPPEGRDVLRSSGSAVDLLESLLQQGKTPSGAVRHRRQGAAAAPSVGKGTATQPRVAPAAGWLSTVAGRGSVDLRGSMLAAESTFIFPAGVTAQSAAMAPADEQELQGSSTAVAGGNLDGSSSLTTWDRWQHQEQEGQPTTRTTSAPGHLSSTAGMPLRPTLSWKKGREVLMTPGGSDLTAVVNRNADKLRALRSMPDTGSTEALDQFLAKFVVQCSQPRHATTSGSGTPISRLATPQVQIRPHRYSNPADTMLATGTGVAMHNVSSLQRMPGVADALDLELSKLEIHKAGATMGHGAGAAAAAHESSSLTNRHMGPSLQAQQRLLLAGTAAGINAAAAAAGLGSSVITAVGGDHSHGGPDW